MRGWPSSMGVRAGMGRVVRSLAWFWGSFTTLAAGEIRKPGRKVVTQPHPLIQLHTDVLYVDVQMRW